VKENRTEYGSNELAAAHELGMSYQFEVMHGCALCNTLAVMQFLHAQGCYWEEMVCTAAAERGCFEMLRWAREHGCGWEHQRILQSAVSSGNIEMTAWVRQHPDVTCSSDVLCAAARNGHTAMCAYLYAEGLALSWDCQPPGSSTVAASARR
jgi:hypothetical protein